MTIPANKMYETPGIETTKNCYRALADDEPVDIDEELDNEIIYVEPFGNDDTTTKNKETTAAAAARTTAAAAATIRGPAMPETKKKETTEGAVATITAIFVPTKQIA